VEEAGVSLRVCCDGGRTVLHDACWTQHPSFDCIRYILEHHQSDLVYCTDRRGFTPLDYVPRDSHAAWHAFLLDCGADLFAGAATATTK
jgi:Ankyrin repeats (many copies)